MRDVPGLQTAGSVAYISRMMAGAVWNRGSNIYLGLPEKWPGADCKSL